jgi:hypothetical protein
LTFFAIWILVFFGDLAMHFWSVPSHGAAPG